MSSAPREGEAGKRAALLGLRTALLNGDVAPGQRLVEPDLAETFGVTRAAIRAALIDLTGEGLVERIPNRGARVRAVSIEEAIAITECRMVLEVLCAAKAAERINDDQADSLQQLGTQMRAAVSNGEPMEYSRLNSVLHQTVREVAEQPVAADLLERLHRQMARYQLRLSSRPGRFQASLREHLAIIDAIVQRDHNGAERAARSHLESVIGALHDFRADVSRGA